MALRPIFFDTETTGVRPETDRIIELAAFDPKRDKTFVQLINPKMAIPADATAVHQITDAMVQSAPSFSQVAQEFVAFCEGEIILIGHNSDAFDIPFLRAEFTRNGMALPTHWLFVDSLKWARKYRRDLPRHALQYLRQMYGIQPNQAHRALNDVMMLHQIFQIMTDDLTCEQIISLIGKTSMNEEAKKPVAAKSQEALSLFA